MTELYDCDLHRIVSSSQELTHEHHQYFMSVGAMLAETAIAPFPRDGALPAEPESVRSQTT